MATFSLVLASHLLAFAGFVDPVTEARTYRWRDTLMKFIILGNVAVESVFDTHKVSHDEAELEHQTLDHAQLPGWSSEKSFITMSNQRRTSIEHASLEMDKHPFNIAELVRRCVEMKHPYLAPGVTVSAGP
jgi:hypothetical protein